MGRTAWLSTGLVFIMAVATVLLCSGLEDETLTRNNLQGSWEDRLEPGVFYYAASTHSLTFSSDSFFLSTFHFTDVAYLDTCYATAFHQRMRGTFTIGNPDTLFLDGIYVDSLGAPLPPCGCTAGPRKWGPYTAVFRARVVDGELHLKQLPDTLYYYAWELKKED